jgi:hypothetical protein
MNVVETNSRNKVIRDLYRRTNSRKLKTRCQPRNNFVNDRMGDVLADYCIIFNRGRTASLSHIMCVCLIVLGTLQCKHWSA